MRIFNDFGHAIDCFQKGVQLNVESYCYVRVRLFLPFFHKP